MRKMTRLKRSGSGGEAEQTLKLEEAHGGKGSIWRNGA